MKKILTFAAVVGGTVSAPALAQSGLHIGAIAGYEGIHVESSDGSVTADASSAVYGLNVGYDLGLGGVFVGIEGELSTSGGSTSSRTAFPARETGCRQMSNTMSVPAPVSP